MGQPNACGRVTSHSARSACAIVRVTSTGCDAETRWNCIAGTLVGMPPMFRPLEVVLSRIHHQLGLVRRTRCGLMAYRPTQQGSRPCKDAEDRPTHGNLAQLEHAEGAFPCSSEGRIGCDVRREYGAVCRRHDHPWNPKALLCISFRKGQPCQHLAVEDVSSGESSIQVHL
jgi:hypothetical protein